MRVLACLQEAIDERQRELQRIADILAQKAESYISTSRKLKTAMVVLGAASASQGTFQKMGASNSGSFDYAIVVFTLLGIVIASLAGIEAAFKFDSRAAELNVLASVCHSTFRVTDAALVRAAIARDIQTKITEANALIDTQNARLAEIQSRASTTGINITLALRENELVKAWKAAVEPPPKGANAKGSSLAALKKKPKNKKLLSLTVEHKY